ncbi:hypothetical protein HA402_000550 [Bradysia odoriphaga]|nr:hypothetical protein HA402_000550 [Bradysia odoriphaga]
MVRSNYIICCCVTVTVLYVTTEVLASKSIDYFEPKPLSIVNAMQKILRNFYYRTATTLYVKMSYDVAVDTIVSELVDQLVQTESGKLFLTFVIENCTTAVYQNYRRSYNLFVVDNYVGFRRIYDQLSPEVFDYSGYYTIVLVESNIESSQETINRILSNCWALYITNVHILASTLRESEELYLYTYYPYTVEHCEIVKPVVQNIFVNGTFVHNASMFPLKLQNFYECPVTVSTYSFWPFMILTESNNGSYHMDGLDGKTLRVIANHLNFTPIVKLALKNVVKEIKVEVYSEKQSTLKPSLHMLSDNTANLSIGGLVASTQRLKLYDMCVPYHHGSLRFAVPPGKKFSSLEKIFFPFRYKIWYCLSVLFAFVILAIISMKSLTRTKRTFIIGDRNDAPLLNTVNICFGGSLTRIPKRNFARTLLIIWIVCAMIVRNAYQGTLFGFLRGDQRNRPFSQMDEIFESNVKIYAIRSFFQELYDAVPAIRDRLEIYSGNISELTKLQDDDFDGVFMTQIFDYYTYLHPNDRIFQCKEIIRMVSYTIYLRKHSCLTQPLNQQIQMLTSSGLISGWNSNFKRNSASKLRTTDQIEPKRLSVDQVNGLIVICMILYAISVIVFVFELVSSRRRPIKIVLDYFSSSGRTMSRRK